MGDRHDHHHHHQHHRRHSSSSDDDQPPPPSFRPPYDDQPPPPPPHFSSYDNQPPPPPPHFSSYENQPPPYHPSSGGYQPSYDNQPPPPPFSSSYENQPPPYHRPDHTSSGGYQPSYDDHPPPQHTSGGGYNQSSGSHYSHAPDPRISEEPEERHSYRPHMPEFIESRIHGHGHQSEGGGGSGPELDLDRKPSVKVYCKADTNHMLAIRNGKVILARSDPNDPTQHWVKDEKYSTKVKDQDGYPSYALVNKGTGQALKHSIGATHPVQLIAYNPAVLDESILWTSGKDLGSEYRQIRMVNNTRLVFDAFNGDKKHGGVHDGTTIVLWEPGKGDNQRWHITPY